MKKFLLAASMMVADNHILTFKTWDSVSMGFDLRANYLTNGKYNLLVNTDDNNIATFKNVFKTFIGDLGGSGLSSYRGITSNLLNWIFIGVDFRPTETFVVSLNLIPVVTTVVDIVAFKNFADESKFDFKLHLPLILAIFTFELEVHHYISFRMNLGHFANRFMQCFLTSEDATFFNKGSNWGAFVLSFLDLIYPDLNQITSFHPFVARIANSVISLIILGAVTQINMNYLIDKKNNP